MFLLSIFIHQTTVIIHIIGTIRMGFGLLLCQNDEVDKSTKNTYDVCKNKIDHLTLTNVKIKTTNINHHIYILRTRGSIIKFH